MLKDQLTEDVKTAMKSGDKQRVATLRFLLSTVKDYEINNRTPADDATVRQILQKAIKTRQDSIEEFKKGGREDLVGREEAEIEIIKEYLPEAPSEETIARTVDEVIAETNASGMKDMGPVIKETISRLDGMADGGTVSKIVKDKLSSK